MESPSSRKSSSNKIRDIVRLQQMLKKWKKMAITKHPSTSNSSVDVGATNSSNSTSTASRSIKFLKKTLSFSESSSSMVPKGYVAVCVGKDEKRFVIPTEYLSHQVFAILLREAEEEFGFQQTGVLKLPCEVDLFHKILSKMMQEDNVDNASLFLLRDQESPNVCSPNNAQLSLVPSQSQLCR